MLEHFEHFEIIEKNESFSKKIIEKRKEKFSQKIMGWLSPKIFENANQFNSNQLKSIKSKLIKIDQILIKINQFVDNIDAIN